MRDELFSLHSSALLLIGFQNDSYSVDGVLRSAYENEADLTSSLENSLKLVKGFLAAGRPVFSTPIIFTPDYSELQNPIGILAKIRSVQAFRRGTVGAEAIPALNEFGDQIVELPGRRGLNSFSNTDLESALCQAGIESIIICGAITSLCVDSTSRSATERGYRVIIPRDCICGRTTTENWYYCEQIFPLYCYVQDSGKILQQLGNLPQRQAAAATWQDAGAVC